MVDNINDDENNRDNIQDDATGISQTKTLDKNSYLGTVEIKCLINGYCPFTHDLVESTMVLNSNSLVSLPDVLRQQFNYVPGLPGIYLREIYRYRSNWLMFGATAASSPGVTNPTSATSKEDLEPEIAAATVGSDGSSPDYKWQQTWQVVPSPVDGLRVPIPSQLSCITCQLAIMNDSKARFSYIRPSRSIEGNEKEANDSTVLAIQQSATGQAGQPGVHWKVEKKEPLFKGEDFFIEFIGTVLQQDLSKTESKPFVGTGYECIDVQIDDSKQTSKGPPKNFGVVGYNIIAGTPQPIRPTREEAEMYANQLKSGLTGQSFSKDKESMQKFDLHRQSYAIIEMKSAASQNVQFFIILPINSKPTFIKVVKSVSYNISTYEGTTCKELFGRTSFRITVRNHLGYIVITFDGYEDMPWIIGNDLEVDGSEDKIFRVPEDCSLSIWGGNLPIAFSFAPLQYGKNASLSIPPETRGSDATGTVLTSPNPFVLPKVGVKQYFFLSSADTVPKGIRSTSNQKLDYADFKNTREPYYTCDAIEIEEPGEGSGAAVKSGINGVKPCNFTDTEDYIKKDGGKDAINPKLILTKKTSSDSTGITNKNGPGADAVIGADTSGKFTYVVTNLELISGNHKFENTDKDSPSAPSTGGSVGGTSSTTYNCKTPIATHVRALAVPDGKNLWEPDEKNVSSHVLHFKDSWSSSDYNTCEHTGDISFLLDPSGGDEGKLKQTTFLEGLKDKMFYIEVWVRYTKCSYALGEDNQFYKLFTGMCAGGTIKQQPVERIMECKLVDYMTVLKDKFFWNSSFFDAVRDVNAVYEVLTMASFKSAPPEDGDDPAGCGPPLQYLKESVNTDGTATPSTLDSRKYTCDEYVLPFSWSRLQSPTFRYPDGTKLYDSLADWAKRGSRMFFFDQHGMFHWENSAGIAMSKGKAPEPLWEFSSGEGGSGSGQLTFNSYTKEGAVTDIYNDIHMITSTPNMEIISKGEINWPSIEDPKSDGFIGYRKVMLQQESFFGNEDAITNAIKYYKAFWKAPAVYSFETSGQPVRIFDTMSFNGNKLLITSVSSDLDPKENKWWQQIQGEYFQGT